MSETIKVFGLTIANETLAEATAAAVAAAKSGQRRIIFFVNAHCINVAAKDPEYHRAIPSADRIYADGIGMKIAARLAGFDLADNVNGTDMFPKLCGIAEQEGVSLALLGARPGIAERCAANMKGIFQDLRIPLVQDGYFKPGDEPAVIERINQSGAGILLVAFGVPGQELWIARNAGRIRTPVILAVGGLFDFYSGLRKRAPWLLRKAGLEWTFRLAQEPVRLFSRYILGNPLFLLRALALRAAGRGSLADRIHPCRRG